MRSRMRWLTCSSSAAAEPWSEQGSRTILISFIDSFSKTSTRNSSISGNSRMTFSMALGNTLTPRTITISSTRPNTPPLQKQKWPTAWTRLVARLNQIAGSITDDGTADPAEISDNQFTLFSVTDGPANVGVQNLSNKFTFVNVDGCRLRLALETESSYFGRACMIIALRAPGLFNHLSCARNTRPGFARMDGYFYGGLFGEIHAGFRASDAMCSAYVGVQTSTVAP